MTCYDLEFKNSFQILNIILLFYVECEQKWNFNRMSIILRQLRQMKTDQKYLLI